MELNPPDPEKMIFSAGRNVSSCLQNYIYISFPDFVMKYL